MDKGFHVNFRLFLRGESLREDRPVRIDAWIHMDSQRLNLGTTGCRVRPSEWDSYRQIVLEKNDYAGVLNETLEEISLKVHRIYYSRLVSNQRCTLEDIKGDWRCAAAAPNPSELHLGYVLERFIENRSQQWRSSQCVQVYRVLQRHLAHYMDRDDLSIPINALGREFIPAFQRYLENACHLKPSTIYTRLKMLKSVLRFAQEEFGCAPKAIQVKLHAPVSQPRFLTDSALQQLSAVHAETAAEQQVKDMFFFAVYTGLGWAEVARLQVDMLTQVEDRTHLLLHRQKTGRPLNVLLISPALAIMHAHMGRDADGLIFPPISYRHAVRILDRLRNRAGLATPLTFHVARHTFATRALNEGIPIASVSRMLGHANIQTTQIYARITDRRTISDMEYLESRWNVGARGDAPGKGDDARRAQATLFPLGDTRSGCIKSAVRCAAPSDWCVNSTAKFAVCAWSSGHGEEVRHE